MLGAFDIKYLPRMAMKGKILADLVAEFTEELDDSEEARKPEEAMGEFNTDSVAMTVIC